MSDSRKGFKVRNSVKKAPVELIETLIMGGEIATSQSVVDGGIAIEDGKITAISGHGFVQNAAKVIDARGENCHSRCNRSHVHLKTKSHGTVTKDDFEAGSIAAALGGVTTFIDFAVQWGNMTPTQAISETRSNADDLVSIDYSLHLSY